MRRFSVASLLVFSMTVLTATTPKLRCQPTASPSLPGSPPSPTFPRQLCESRTPIFSLPFVIDECGSYYLTRCLIGEEGSAGITIQAKDVTIDLNGFSLLGVEGTLDGVVVSGTRRNISIFGGTVSGWGADGINARSAENCQFRNLRLSDNSGDGIAAGPNSVFLNCVAEGNGASGLVGPAQLNGNGSGAVFTNCSAKFNTDFGVLGGEGAVISDCSAYNNGIGIRASEASIIERCALYSNASHGVLAGGECIVRTNSCDQNGGAGIAVYEGSHGWRIEGNHITDSNPSISIVNGRQGLVIKNTVDHLASITGTNVSWGPFIDLRAHSGSIAGVAGADHPWANFIQ